jgi:hypothetical protein
MLHRCAVPSNRANPAGAGSALRGLWRRFPRRSRDRFAAIAHVPVTEDDLGPKDGADWSFAE